MQLRRKLTRAASTFGVFGEPPVIVDSDVSDAEWGGDVSDARVFRPASR